MYHSLDNDDASEDAFSNALAVRPRDGEIRVSLLYDSLSLNSAERLLFFQHGVDIAFFVLLEWTSQNVMGMTHPL